MHPSRVHHRSLPFIHTDDSGNCSSDNDEYGSIAANAAAIGLRMDSTNPNFDIQYNKGGHPVKISMDVTREDLDWFKIIYDPMNSTSLFNNGHAHLYKRKDEILKLIDYNWLLESKTVFKISYFNKE